MTETKKDESDNLEHHCQNTFIIYFVIKNKNVSIAELKLKCLKSENYIVNT